MNLRGESDLDTWYTLLHYNTYVLHAVRPPTDTFLCLDRKQYILVLSRCDVAIKLLFFYPIGDTFVSVGGWTSMTMPYADRHAHG